MNLNELKMSIAENMRPTLSYNPKKDFAVQQTAVREKLCELLRMPKKLTNPTPIIEWEDKSDPRYDEIRFKFESEPDFFVPAHLILPKNRGERTPVVICLQGHTAGMHVSLARTEIGSKETAEVKGDRDFAIQTVSRGYAAVIMEQRGFGEQSSDIPSSRPCNMPAMQALAVGRTLLGERVFDVSRLIDAIAEFDCLDHSRIGLMGNSAGGTTSYYAACMDTRVTAVMPSCFFGEFKNSFLKYNHCVCGFIPDFLKWFDLPDLAVTIAPRPLIIVSGLSDAIADIDSARRGFEEVVKPIYAAAGAPDACRQVVGPEGHRFYADLSWPVFDELFR